MAVPTSFGVWTSVKPRPSRVRRNPATESGANVFALDYFGRPAYLAQSPQFYKQAMVGVFERVYEVGPVFRAEPHDTVRHLAQYTSLDVELGFIADHRDVMGVLTTVLKGMLERISEREPAAAAAVDGGLPAVPDEIPAVHFADALAIAGADPAEPDLAPADGTAASMPAITSRSTAITSRWSLMKPNSTSSDVYWARWRTVSCGSARKTGPTS